MPSLVQFLPRDDLPSSQTVNGDGQEKLVVHNNRPGWDASGARFRGAAHEKSRGASPHGGGLMRPGFLRAGGLLADQALQLFTMYTNRCSCVNKEYLLGFLRWTRGTRTGR
jgi:hypothetical protein